MLGQQNIKKWDVLLSVQFLLTGCAIGRQVSNKRSETTASVHLLSVQTNTLCRKQTFLNEGINYRQIRQQRGKKHFFLSWNFAS